MAWQLWHFTEVFLGLPAALIVTDRAQRRSRSFSCGSAAFARERRRQDRIAKRADQRLLRRIPFGRRAAGGTVPVFAAP